MVDDHLLPSKILRQALNKKLLSGLKKIEDTIVDFTDIVKDHINECKDQTYSKKFGEKESSTKKPLPKGWDKPAVCLTKTTGSTKVFSRQSLAGTLPQIQNLAARRNSNFSPIKLSRDFEDDIEKKICLEEIVEKADLSVEKKSSEQYLDICKSTFQGETLEDYAINSISKASKEKRKASSLQDLDDDQKFTFEEENLIP